MNPLKRWIMALLAPDIEAMITNRLVMFHDALIERGQIDVGTPIPPKVDLPERPAPDLKVVK